MQVVVLAGGQVTRLRPLTDAQVEPLTPFVSAPFLGGVIRGPTAADVPGLTLLVDAQDRPWRPLAAMGAELGVQVLARREKAPFVAASALPTPSNRTPFRAPGNGPLVCGR